MKPKQNTVAIALDDSELDILEQVHSIYALRDPYLHVSRSAVVRSVLIPALEEFLKTQKQK